MPMWTAKSSGTRKPGIKSQGNVVMMAALGSPKNKRTGPGEEVAPKKTASIKSNAPTMFQIHKIGRELSGCR